VEEVGAGVEQGEEREEGRDGKKKKNRCLSCKKKVGLTGERPFSFSDFPRQCFNPVTIDSWIRDPGWKRSGSEVRENFPGLHIRELSNNFLD
jgi:hypothetical protein